VISDVVEKIVVDVVVWIVVEEVEIILDDRLVVVISPLSRDVCKQPKTNRINNT